MKLAGLRLERDLKSKDTQDISFKTKQHFFFSFGSIFWSYEDCGHGLGCDFQVHLYLAPPCMRNSKDTHEAEETGDILQKHS